MKSTPQPVIYSSNLYVGAGVALSAAELENSLNRSMLQLQQKLKAADALIGHIKLFAEDDAERENLWLSTTGKVVNAKRSAGWLGLVATSYRISLTAIVFNIPAEKLVQMVPEIFSAVATEQPDQS